jgi:hypothetical protein
VGSFLPIRLAVSITAVAAALAVGACGEKSEPEVVEPVDSGATQDTTTETTGGGGQNGRQGGGAQGGGGGGGQAIPEEQVEEAVSAVLGGRSTSDSCAGLVTERYVKSAYGDVKGCRAAVSTQGSFNVQVSAVRVTGSKATAKAKPAAGPNRGETINVKLVDEQGAWRVDSALSNAPAGP